MQCVKPAATCRKKIPYVGSRSENRLFPPLYDLAMDQKPYGLGPIGAGFGIFPLQCFKALKQKKFSKTLDKAKIPAYSTMVGRPIIPHLAAVVKSFFQKKMHKKSPPLRGRFGKFYEF